MPPEVKEGRKIEQSSSSLRRGNREGE